MTRNAHVVRWLLGIPLAGVALYLLAGACILRFAMARVLFPHTPAFDGQAPASIERLESEKGNELLIRRYGVAGIGCVVFFPGQHGYAAKYDIGPYIAAGLEVLVLAYPGQDGASGSATLEDVEALARRAVQRAHESCPKHKVVLVGVSLGAMLAAYSARDPESAGLVLVAAAPSLSAAIRVRLLSKWYLAPLGVLPLSRLLPHDYSLAEGVGRASVRSVVVFQGSEDQQTPVSELNESFSQINGVRVVRVPGGTHSTTWHLSREAQISFITDLLQQQPVTSMPEKKHEPWATSTAKVLRTHRGG